MTGATRDKGDMEWRGNTKDNTEKRVSQGQHGWYGGNNVSTAMSMQRGGRREEGGITRANKDEGGGSYISSTN